MRRTVAAVRVAMVTWEPVLPSPISLLPFRIEVSANPWEYHADTWRVAPSFYLVISTLVFSAILHDNSRQPRMLPGHSRELELANKQLLPQIKAVGKTTPMWAIARWFKMPECAVGITDHIEKQVRYGEIVELNQTEARSSHKSAYANMAIPQTGISLPKASISIST